MKYIFFLILIAVSLSCVADEEKKNIVEDFAIFKVRGFDTPSQLFLAISTAQRSTLAGYFDYRTESTVPQNYEPISFYGQKDMQLYRVCPQAALKGYLYSRFGEGYSVLSTCVFVNDNLKEAVVLIYGTYEPPPLIIRLISITSESILADYFRYTVRRLHSEKWQVETSTPPKGLLFKN